MNTLISVIVPVYNNEKYIAECIESIQRQSYRTLEILLVNDGSTDNSLEICLDYAKGDSRIQVIDQINAGVSAARNHGLRVATGEYVGFVDSDDTISRQMYEIMIKRLNADGSDLCVMTSYTINPLPRFIKDTETSMNASDAVKSLFFLSFPTSLCVCIYCKDVLDGLLLDESIHFFEDFEFNFRVLSRAQLISLCSHHFYQYRRNEHSVNNQGISKKQMTCLMIADKLFSTVKVENRNNFECLEYFHSHCIVSVISGIARAGRSGNAFIAEARTKIKGTNVKIFRSQNVPVLFKLLIAGFIIQPNLILCILRNTKYRYSKTSNRR